MDETKIVKLLEGYEMPCGSGEYEFIHQKDYQAIAKELLAAINYTRCCGDVVCGNCDGYGYTVDENCRRKDHCKECE
jgi:hypothetical protein